MNHLGVEAISAFSGDTNGISLVWLAGLLALMLAIALISSRFLRLRTVAVRHLFLKIKIEFKNNIETGFIRALDVDRALLVTSFHPLKNDSVNLDLSSLPEFPASEASVVQARVKRVKAIGGQPKNFLVEVRFARSHSRPHTTPLTLYLRQLHKA